MINTNLSRVKILYSETEQALEKYARLEQELKMLIRNLDSYKFETIDKRFFEQFYDIGNGYTSLTLNKSLYPRLDYTLNIKLRGIDVMLQNRTRRHVIEQAEEALTKVREWADSASARLENLQTIKWDKFENDLLNLVNSAGVKDIWYYVHDSIKSL